MGTRLGVPDGCWVAGEQAREPMTAARKPPSVRRRGAAALLKPSTEPNGNRRLGGRRQLRQSRGSNDGYGPKRRSCLEVSSDRSTTKDLRARFRLQSKLARV